MVNVASPNGAPPCMGHGDQDKVGYHHFHFDRQDPHSTAAALDTCTLDGECW